ncbi:MAG TPA: methyltransferase domain-containing protein [Inquilinus sp.]
MAIDIDVRFYQKQPPDLAHLNAQEARHHYASYGIREGRLARPDGVREGFLTLVPTDKPVLEIGPFANPAVRGDNVRYADVLTTGQLRARAIEIGYDPNGCPEIHYPLPTLDLGTISERFAAVISSHNIEHQPDLVRHLQAVERLLRPGGRYFLLVPDKRYCFDHFLPETTIADVMSAYMCRPKVHDIRSVIEHWALTTHNDPARHWDGDHGRPHIETTLEPLKRAISTYESNPEQYVDVHAWQFTPQSFEYLFNLIADLGLTRLRPQVVHPTVHLRNEFCAVLG